MNICLCIKQVPGTSQVEVDPVTGVLKRDLVAGKLNPYDLYAIETAMRLKEEEGADVCAITMGPGQASAVLMEAMYMGADEGVLISDRKFAGADVLATSYTLSQGIRKAGDFDLILCGKQTTDGDTAQVGAEIAEFLGIPHANNVLSIERAAKDSVTVRINLESHIATQRMTLPCLLCMDSEVNTPRLPSYKRKKELAGKQVRTLTLADLEDKEERHYGLAGSPTQVERIFPPEKNAGREVLEGEEDKLAGELADILHERKFI